MKGPLVTCRRPGAGRSLSRRFSFRRFGSWQETESVGCTEGRQILVRRVMLSLTSPRSVSMGLDGLSVVVVGRQLLYSLLLANRAGTHAFFVSFCRS